MPKKVLSEFVYACDICGGEYKDASQKGARRMAVACEFTGTPYAHKYKVGDIVSAKSISIFMDGRKILELVFERGTHRPAYYVEYGEVSYIKIFIVEEDIEGLYPRR